MLSEFMAWIQQMICLVIFMTMMLQILPNQKYVKYIRFFAGLILIAALMKPLVSFLGEENWEDALFSQIAEQETADMDLSGMERIQEEVYEEYESRLTEDLAE